MTFRPLHMYVIPLNYCPKTHLSVGTDNISLLLLSTIIDCAYIENQWDSGSLFVVCCQVRAEKESGNQVATGGAARRGSCYHRTCRSLTIHYIDRYDRLPLSIAANNILPASILLSDVNVHNKCTVALPLCLLSVKMGIIVADNNRHWREIYLRRNRKSSTSFESFLKRTRYCV